MSIRDPYLKDGKEYLHITYVLDYFPAPQLVDWKINVGRKEARRLSTIATKIGSNVDEAIKADVCGLKMSKLKSIEAKNCFEAYLQWKKDYQFVLAIPDTIFHDDLGVAGTPDLASPLSVIDIKCSADIRPCYWLQTEFYGRKLPVMQKAILRLDKNLGMYEYKQMTLNDEHWEVCVGLIKAFRFFNKPVCDAPQKEVA